MLGWILVEFWRPSSGTVAGRSDHQDSGDCLLCVEQGRTKGSAQPDPSPQWLGDLCDLIIQPHLYSCSVRGTTSNLGDVRMPYGGARRDLDTQSWANTTVCLCYGVSAVSAAPVMFQENDDRECLAYFCQSC